jgi:tRNA splicing ligase
MRKDRKETQSRKGENMTEASRQPKDKNYNLISVLYQSSDNVESLKTYIQDAEADGDQELVEFFGAVLENNLEAAQRAKEMLVPRFQSEQE